MWNKKKIPTTEGGGRIPYPSKNRNLSWLFELTIEEMLSNLVKMPHPYVFLKSAKL